MPHRNLLIALMVLDAMLTVAILFLLTDIYAACR